MGHYFMNDDTLGNDIRVFDISIFDKKYVFYTNSGVFAKSKFDYGTRLLLNNLVINKSCGKILDLGCGYGVVGVILGDKYKKFDIDMVDINDRAVKLSKKNLSCNGVSNAKAFVSDVFSNVSFVYDYIVTNPPIKAGKEVVKKFLLGSYNYLCNDGELWFVMRKDHGVKSMIELLNDIYITKIIDKDKGFYIVKAIKK